MEVGYQRYVRVGLLPGKARGTHYTAYWVSSRAGLDVCGEEKIRCHHRVSNPEPFVLLRINISYQLTLFQPYSQRGLNFLLFYKDLFFLLLIFDLFSFLVAIKFVSFIRKKCTFQTFFFKKNVNRDIFKKWMQKNIFIIVDVHICSRHILAIFSYVISPCIISL